MMGSKAKFVTLNEKNFEAEVIQSTQPVLVDFWATWCAPCHVIAPTIEELAAEFEGKVKVGKLDMDASEGVGAQYGVRAIPTLIFFKDGEAVDRMTGVAPKNEIVARLEALLEKAGSNA